MKNYPPFSLTIQNRFNDPSEMKSVNRQSHCNEKFPRIFKKAVKKQLPVVPFHLLDKTQSPD